MLSVRWLAVLATLAVSCADQVASRPEGATSGRDAPTAAPSASASAARPVASAALPEEPSPAELAAAPRIAIEDPPGLGCDLQVVRQYLRVTCRAVGGRPAPTIEVDDTSGLSITTGRAADEPYVEALLHKGLGALVTFTWGEESRHLELSWPPGEPAPATPRFGPAFPTLAAPCAASGMAGRGTIGDPCIFRGASPVTVKHVAGAREVVNRTDDPVVALITEATFLDASGRRLAPRGGSPDAATSRQSLSFWQIVRPRSTTTLDGLALREAPPEGTATIELEVCGYNVKRGRSTLHFRAADACTPEPAPKGGPGSSSP